jgi:uncharacterized protein YbaA (DUF1428 family)
MRYVDGFVFPVPKKKIAAYRKIARKAGKIWRDHGALQYCESIGEDLEAKGGPVSVVPFGKMAKVKRGETVGFSWIVYKSRAHRDQVNAKVMKDPRLTGMTGPMPIDIKRMAYGGFTILVDL